jgi:hypothetical protein
MEIKKKQWSGSHGLLQLGNQVIPPGKKPAYDNISQSLENEYQHMTISTNLWKLK